MDQYLEDKDDELELEDINKIRHGFKYLKKVILNLRQTKFSTPEENKELSSELSLVRAALAEREKQLSILMAMKPPIYEKQTQTNFETEEVPRAPQANLHQRMREIREAIDDTPKQNFPGNGEAKFDLQEPPQRPLDKQAAFKEFQAKYPDGIVLNENLILVKKKYEDAKVLGVAVKEEKQEMGNKKMKRRMIL